MPVWSDKNEKKNRKSTKSFGRKHKRKVKVEVFLKADSGFVYKKEVKRGTPVCVIKNDSYTQFWNRFSKLKATGDRTNF